MTTDGDWIGRVRLMESEEEWGSLIAERARESVQREIDGRERGRESVQGESE